ELMADQDAVIAEFHRLQKARGYDVTSKAPADRGQSEFWVDQQKALFRTLAGDGGDSLRGGLVGDFVRALRSEKLDRGDVARIAAQIAFELVTKPDAASAQSATRIIKANLALITDPARQTSGIAALRAALDSELSGARAMFRGVQQRPITLED